MSTRTPVCDDCGRGMEKAHRVENGVAYCATCYQRIFRPRRCEKCGATARIHRAADSPVCRACLRASRTCLRCEKPVGKAGKLVRGGALCASCARYAGVPGRCAYCGRTSRWLSRSSSLGLDEPACPKCRSSERPTCSVCRHQRKPAACDEEGRPVCEACAAGIVHGCPGCGADVPGIGQCLCESCARSARIDRRVAFDTELLEQDWVRDHFQSFCRHRSLDRRSSNIIRRIDRHAVFFRELDKHFSSPGAVTQDRLFDVFGLDELRKAATVIRYLVESTGLEWDRAVLEEKTEERRVDALLHAADGRSWGPELRAYRDFLVIDQGGTRKAKTVRCYVSAVSRLFGDIEPGVCKDLTQKRLDHYLSRNKGARANLTLFVRYAKGACGLDLVVGKKGTRSLAMRDRTLIRDVGRLKSQLSATANSRCARAVLAALLVKAYQVPLGDVLSLRRNDVRYSEGAISLTFAGADFDLVPDLAAPFEKWVLPGDGEYLFPGRSRIQPLSKSAVWYHVRD